MTGRKMIYAVIVLFMSSIAVLVYNSHNWIMISAGLILACVSLLIAIFSILLKSKTPDKIGYLIIIAIGVAFLVAGILL